MMRNLWITAALASLAACTAMNGTSTSGQTAAATGKDAWKAARPVGKPESCIPIAQIRESRVRDDSTIDFYTVGRRVYRNVLPHSCPSLGFEKAFSYATSLSQLCSTDIITVLHQGGGRVRGASCGLGQFQPVEGAPR
jgi:hypothetical protein